MSFKYSLKLKVLDAQLHLALYNSMYFILLSSSIHGILQTECWSELPFPSPGDLPDPGIEPRSLTLQADSLLSEPQRKPICTQEAEFNRKKGSPVKMKISPEGIKTQLHKTAWSKPSKCTPASPSGCHFEVLDLVTS